MKIYGLLGLALVASLVLALAACGGGGDGGKATPNNRRTATAVTGGTPTIPQGTAETAAQTAEPFGSAGGTPDETTREPRSSGAKRRDERRDQKGERIQYDVTFRLTADPGGLQGELDDADAELPDQLEITVQEGTVHIRAEDEFIDVDGTISADGSFTASGTGAFGRWRDVSATFEGTLLDSGLTGSYTLGGLPGGQSLTYEAQGEED